MDLPLLAIGPADTATRLVELRRRLHENPEIGLSLPVTQQTVLAALHRLPLEISTGSSSSSITAVLRGGRPGPTVLLRADMDALPVREVTGLPYASRIDGAMHACGHDLHTAMLVGAAEILCADRETLAGSVVFMFQAGEEGWEGARLMLDEGVLTASGDEVSAAYAIHVFSNLPTGTIRTRPGAMMAASAELDVRVVGRGGHAAAPHLAHDPVPAMAEMIGALQRAVGRDLDRFDPAVLSIGVVEAGQRPNVIPDSARFVGSVRTMSLEAQAQTEKLARRVIGGIADAHGVTAEVTFESLRPPLINDPHEAEFALQTARDLFGADRVEVSSRPEDGSEDFARVLDLVPGCFICLGAGTAGAPYNHAPEVIFDDAAVIDGASLLASLATRRLR